MKEIEIDLRRARVKNCLLKGLTVNDIAKLEGMAEVTISKDVRAIGRKAFLAKTEESTSLIFKALVEEVEWAIEEAKAIHENSKEYYDDSGKKFSGGRIDVLKYITDEDRKLVEIAQELGLLDKMAEKSEVILKTEISNEKIKEYGDWLAQHISKEDLR